MRALQLPADAGPRDDGTGAERGSVAAGREPCRPSGNAASAAAPSLGPEHRGNGWRASMRSCSREGRGRRSSPSARAWFCLSSRAWCVGAEVGAERALRRPFVLRRSASGSARTVPRAPRPPAPRGQQRSSALYPWLSGAAGGERRARASPAAFGSVCGAGWAAPRRAAGARPGGDPGQLSAFGALVACRAPSRIWGEMRTLRSGVTVRHRTVGYVLAVRLSRCVRVVTEE